MFFQLLKHAEQRSFVSPIMMIEHNFPTKKQTCIKITIQKIGELLVVHLAWKNCKTKVYIPVYGPIKQEKSAGLL